jgi:hypothetical protein
MIDYDIVLAAIIEQARKVQQEAEAAKAKPKKRFR